MTAMRVRLAALTAACLRASAQPLSMSACADSACSVACTSWGTSAGTCAPGTSSLPSSISTLTTLTIFSAGDTTCSGSSTVYTINADGNCNQVTSSGVAVPFFYVRATNLTGAIVGGVVGGLVALALIIVGVIFCCRASGVDCCVGCCGPARKTTVLVIQTAQAQQAQAQQGPYPPGFAPPPPAGAVRV